MSRREPGVPILVHHQVMPCRVRSFRKYVVTPRAFRAQMNWLAHAGYVAIGLDGETGILVLAADAAALAAAIRVLSDPALSRRLGAAGRQRVEQQFSAAAMVRGINRIYEQVLARRRLFAPALADGSSDGEGRRASPGSPA